jgi:hypothetical protein
MAKGAASKPRRDDLPAIHASRLRKLGAITPDMKRVRLDPRDMTPGGFGAAFDVGLAHTHFPNGGGWSYFVCPCGRLARTLRLLEARLVCRRCDGLLARCQSSGRPGQHYDKGPAIERLLERLAQPSIKRRGKLERRLRRTLIVEREKRTKGWKG